MDLKVTPWPGSEVPTEEEMEEELANQDLRVHRWSSLPDDTFAGHTHGYHKIIYVVEGSIKFEFPTRHKMLTLTLGDRLDLPSGVRHSAVVGSEGVTCLEAHAY